MLFILQTFDFDCLSPAAYIKDSLYPLRRELKKKKQLNSLAQTPEQQPCIQHDADTSSSADDNEISQSESFAYGETSHNDEYDDDDAVDDDDYDYIDDNEPKTPSGLIGSESIMIDSQDMPSDSDESDSDDNEVIEESVLTRSQKRKITIDEKENQDRKSVV